MSPTLDSNEREPADLTATKAGVSGLYQTSSPFFSAAESTAELDDAASLATRSPWPWWWWRREELRLDVDGRYPQMTASGVLYSGLALRVHWIASLSATGSNTWSGTIWFKEGAAASLPHTSVEIKVVRSLFPSQRQATVTFSGGGAAARTRAFRWRDAYFHPVEFEFDTATDTSAVTSIATCDHPNRPAGLPCENLSIETVFRRAGFRVSSSPGSGTVPLAGAGANAQWSDMEMHDAMTTFWSRFDNRAQWSMWVLFAWQHEAVPSQGITPQNLGGIMFDSIGPNHRQGTAIFNGSFIKDPPAGDPAGAAWVRRMRFWTACHEMGHAFNLAHSWQKALGTPWLPLPNEPEARSFMNYPFRVAGGESTFFSDFDFRFSDPELLFLRHAPERFVQMGNADWFDDHGFRQADAAAGSSFALELRVHRQADCFEFLEPVVVELKLSNASSEPLLVDDAILADAEHMTVIVRKRGQPARQWHPYATRCLRSPKTALASGKSLYGSLQISSGLNGWDLAEPGIYDVQVALQVGPEQVVSNSLRLRVAPPRGYDEEYLAQDFFSDEVGRTLAFGGTMVLDGANDTLREVTERFSERRVAYHARLALANPLTRDYKQLVLDAGDRALTSVGQAGGKLKVARADAKTARKEMAAALTANADEAAETLGHICYKGHVDRFSDFLDDKGDPAAAAQCQREMHRCLSNRGVLASVLDGIAQRSEALKKSAAKRPAARKSSKK